MTRGNSVSDLQLRAWQFYGLPGSRQGRAVGEVHYVNAWLADQMTRLDWDILIDGSPEWVITTPDGQVIDTTVIGEDGEPTEDQTTASGELLERIDWNDTNVRAVTTNLFVAGQGDYIYDFPNKTWRVVSVVERDRVETIKKAKERVPFLWPHPADHSMPDAPLFSVLEILEELDWLNRQGRTQSSQRVMIAGIVGISDTFEGVNGTGFWDQWNENLSARMANPDDLSPIRFTGPRDDVKDGINWVVPDFGYDAVLDRKVLACINRLAYGLPVPPEILLGMQAQSRATAFQVEENAYRAHIEPPAHLVAQVAEDALNEILDQEVTVVPNATRLLSRRNSVEDVKWAYTEGLATAGYAREVMGIPEDAAPEDDGVPPGAGGGDIATDPENDVVSEPIAAANSQEDLSVLLADIDFHLSSELAGATAMATDRARQRLGAAARVNPETRKQFDKKLSNGEVASKLGYDGLIAAGVDIDAQIAEPVASAASWWTRRIGEAWTQTATLIQGWSGQEAWMQASSQSLMDALKVHIVETLSDPEPDPLDAESIRTIVDAAAGGS